MKHRVYKDLKPKHRYQSGDFWVTLVKKGYHPKTAAHKPTISVTDYNEYLLEEQLHSGNFDLDGWSYPVLEWKFISRTYHEMYDYTKCVYELTLDMSALPIHKYRCARPDTEHDCGVSGARVKNGYAINGYRSRLVKRLVNVDQSHHVIVVSMDYYHYDALKWHLKTNDVISFNHMLYLVLDYEEVPRKAALKKDGTPYFSSKVYAQFKLKAPGRKIQYEHERRKSVLDEIFEDVQL